MPPSYSRITNMEPLEVSDTDHLSDEQRTSSSWRHYCTHDNPSYVCSIAAVVVIISVAAIVIVPFIFSHDRSLRRYVLRNPGVLLQKVFSDGNIPLTACSTSDFGSYLPTTTNRQTRLWLHSISTDCISFSTFVVVGEREGGRESLGLADNLLDILLHGLLDLLSGGGEGLVLLGLLPEENARDLDDADHAEEEVDGGETVSKRTQRVSLRSKYIFADEREEGYG